MLKRNKNKNFSVFIAFLFYVKAIVLPTTTVQNLYLGCMCCLLSTRKTDRVLGVKSFYIIHGNEAQ